MYINCSYPITLVIPSVTTLFLDRRHMAKGWSRGGDQRRAAECGGVGWCNNKVGKWQRQGSARKVTSEQRTPPLRYGRATVLSRWLPTWEKQRKGGGPICASMDPI
jgi:hypothetical protein